MRSLLFRWIIGGIFGTAIVAITAPLFVRSYLPRPLDPVRGVTTMAPGRTFRWRSEGWANTHIGPHGMPGRRELPEPDLQAIRLAIWGDSQAEGVCVADDKKLHAQIERAARDTRKLDPTSPFLVGLPLGRSGDDAADWLPQFLQVEKTFGVQAHVLLVSEISDLAAILGPIPEAETESFNARIVQQVPMFVIHTMRSLLTTDGYTPRQLRFAVGPTVQPLTKSKSNEKVDRVIQWDLAFGQLAEVTQRPVIVVYAPVIPNITDGKVVSRDSDAGEFDRLMHAANSLDMTVLDMRDAFRRSADTGQWPHGFHNGLIGSGHINSVGYRLIAHSVADAIPQIVTDWE